MMKLFAVVSALLVAPAVLAAPANIDASTLEQNAIDAQNLNAEFANLTANDACTRTLSLCMGLESKTNISCEQLARPRVYRTDPSSRSARGMVNSSRDSDARVVSSASPSPLSLRMAPFVLSLQSISVDVSDRCFRS